jgi:hypothetical protein
MFIHPLELLRADMIVEYTEWKIFNKISLGSFRLIFSLGN